MAGKFDYFEVAVLDWALGAGRRGPDSAHVV